VVQTYRTTNGRIVTLWRNLEDAALRALQRPGLTVPAAGGRARFRIKSDFLWLILPSGRPLAYAKPRIEDRETPWGELRPQVTYLGVNSITRAWERQSAYGGKWTENLVQAIARDLLAAAMLRLEQAGYRIVLSVHDEIIAEVPAGAGSIQEFEDIMCQLPGWAKGCPVAAEGWRGLRYRK
jgi:DNA polymerase